MRIQRIPLSERSQASASSASKKISSVPIAINFEERTSNGGEFIDHFVLIFPSDALHTALQPRGTPAKCGLTPRHRWSYLRGPSVAIRFSCRTPLDGPLSNRPRRDLCLLFFVGQP